MTLFIIGLILIWAGGVTTGYTLGVTAQLTKALRAQQRRREAVANLYPKKGPDDAA